MKPCEPQPEPVCARALRWLVALLDALIMGAPGPDRFPCPTWPNTAAGVR